MNLQKIDMAKKAAYIMNVTPEMASQMLEKNSNNRNVSQRSLNHYIRQIREGQWEFNGDTIRFRKDGVLMDGQHRLLSIVETEKTMECVLITGIRKEAMATIDTGKGRTVADHLKLEGKFNASNFPAISAAISVIFRFQKGKYTETKDRLTGAEAISFLEQNPGLLRSAEATANPDLWRLTTPSIAISCHYLFSKIDRFKAEEFFMRLKTGVNLGQGSPILKLRTELQGMRDATKRRGGRNQRVLVYYMVSAFDAYLHGRKIDRFSKLSADSEIELPKKERGGVKG